MNRPALQVMLVLVSLCAVGAQAQTIKAVSCNSGDVQTALNSATAGSTVVIPAGTCTWAGGVSWNAPANVVLQGQSAVNGAGATDSTLIIVSGAYSLSVTTSATGTFRMTGISFATSYTGEIQGIVNIFGASQSLRIDHCHFNFSNNGSSMVLDINGQIYGVIDHNLFDLSGVTNGVRFEAAGWGGTSGNFGDGSWADSTTFGSNRFVFAEDNVFNNGGSNVSYADDCTQGGRFVMRHNMFNGNNLQTHPTGGGVRHRGCRAEEVYQNTFRGNSSNPSFNGFFASSGTALIWGNTVSEYQDFITIHSMRRNNKTYTQSPTPNGWGYCGTSFNGSGSIWDQNKAASTGYVCLDQPGRGVGDLLANDFPNMTNVTLSLTAWPRQALEPVYEWLNSWSPATGYPSNQYIAVYEPDVLIQNQDYYTCGLTNGTSCAAFTGTTGIGSGLLSARPSTCTPTVAYWATDTNTLYQCSALNSWTVYYTPFKYPHPLTQAGSTITQLSPPTNFQATSR